MRCQSVIGLHRACRGACPVPGVRSPPRHLADASGQGASVLPGPSRLGARPGVRTALRKKGAADVARRRRRGAHLQPLNPWLDAASEPAPISELACALWAVSISGTSRQGPQSCRSHPGIGGEVARLAFVSTTTGSRAGKGSSFSGPRTPEQQWRWQDVTAPRNAARDLCHDPRGASRLPPPDEPGRLVRSCLALEIPSRRPRPNVRRTLPNVRGANTGEDGRATAGGWAGPAHGTVRAVPYRSVGALRGIDHAEQRRIQGAPMNWDRIEGNWTKFKGIAKQQWGKLTDDQLDVIKGKREHQLPAYRDLSRELLRRRGI